MEQNSLGLLSLRTRRAGLFAGLLFCCFKEVDPRLAECQIGAMDELSENQDLDPAETQEDVYQDVGIRPRSFAEYVGQKKVTDNLEHSYRQLESAENLSTIFF